LFALLVGVIVLSLFGSLFAADRALSQADQEAVDLDAHGAALIVERELRLDAVQLGVLFGPLISRANVDSTFVPPEFDAAWVFGRDGRIAWSGGAAPPVDSVKLRTLAAAARAESTAPQVWAIGDSTSGGVLLVVPLTHRGEMLGAAVGFISGQRLLRTLADTTARRPWTALRVNDRVLSARGALHGGESHLKSAWLVRIPGDSLYIDVAHALAGGGLRKTLWMLGVIALAALLGGLARERRQAMYLAGRTAELERLYQEVARSNRMKSEFLANVSHELRTPLNAIVGFVEMLREGVYGELTPRQALPVDRIAASATHLRHLVDRLLDIAKIAAGRLEVHAEPLVLRPFVLNVASEMESLVAERGLALSIGVAPSLPRIRTDQTHLRQILINLIGNAVKYTPSGGISIRARVVGDGAVATPEDDAAPLATPPDAERAWVALQVGDTGIGIARADQERIFDEFEQVNAGARTDSARRGTGLGLAISRRLARLIGGELTVLSEPGRGSVFTVWLPLDIAEKKHEQLG
jgi:two-component system sensor histidine kinase EvgS